FAVTIGDLPALGGDRHMANTTLVTLVLQKPFIQHVELGNAPGHRVAAQPEQADDQAKTPGIETAIGLEREFLHGRTGPLRSARAPAYPDRASQWLPPDCGQSRCS